VLQLWLKAAERPQYLTRDVADLISLLEMFVHLNLPVLQLLLNIGHELIGDSAVHDAVIK